MRAAASIGILTPLGDQRFGLSRRAQLFAATGWQRSATDPVAAGYHAMEMHAI